jgi:hypothetical protein
MPQVVATYGCRTEMPSAEFLVLPNLQFGSIKKREFATRIVDMRQKVMCVMFLSVGIFASLW